MLLCPQKIGTRQSLLFTLAGSEESLTILHALRWNGRAYLHRTGRAGGLKLGVNVARPWSGLKNQVYLGSDRFVARMQALIDPNRSLREVPLKQRRPVAKPLEYYAERHPDRDQAIAAAYRTGAYSMQAIARPFWHRAHDSQSGCQAV